MSTIFISHSSKDNEIARELGTRMAEENHPSAFLDLDPEKGIKAGQSWERTLYRKLRACRAMIALCTDNYLGSHWCFAEIALARMMGKHIIGLQMDGLTDTKMPSILMERQLIDLRGENNSAGWIKLWEGLREEGILGTGSNRHDPKKDGPYLGLATFQEEHSEIFFGRETETRAGIEALGRGAPGLIMVLGASGSGKSSLVRAGMVPRLRADKEEWLIVGPIRPRADPFNELSKALEAAYDDYSANKRIQTPRQNDIARRLRSAAERLPRSSQAFRSLSFDDGGEHVTVPPGRADSLIKTDNRLPELMHHLESLLKKPPSRADNALLDYLDWSIEDLRSIFNRPVGVERTIVTDEERRSPLLGIARHLRRISAQPNARVLLIIDQFEELLGHNDQELADKFLRLLRVSLEADQNTLMILGTMRSDFLGAFQRNASWRGIEYANLSLGPMQMDGLQQVIEKPAKLAEVEIGPGVTSALLRDTETPDALPLLSFTLWKLHKDYADDDLIELDEYEEKLGGIHGAIAKEANQVAEVAKNTGQWDDLAKAFLKMARLNEDQSSYARQTASVADPDIKKVLGILRHFESRRLVVFRKEDESEFVEVAHEALFRSWAPLKKWLDDNRTDMLLKSQIHRDAAAWADTKQRADTLWRGARLLQARDLMKREQLDNDVDEDFIREGMKKRRRTQWIAALSVTSVFVAIGWAAVFSQLAKARAEDTTRVAMAAEWLSRGEPTNAALTLLDVRKPERFPFAAPRMADAIEAGIATLELRGHRFPGVYNAAFDPSTGTRIVTSGRDGNVIIWDATRGAALDTLRIGEREVSGANLSPDGQTIVVAYDTTVQIWTVADGQLHRQSVTTYPSAVNSVVFGPDGNLILAASDDGNAYLSRIAAPDQKMSLAGHTSMVLHAEFSADGQFAITASADSTARIWNVATGGEVGSPLRHVEAVYAATFSPDGQRIVTASAGEAFVWETTTRNRLATLHGHTDLVHSVAVSKTGLVATTGFDDTVRFWDLASGDSLHVITDHRDRVLQAAFSPDGSRLVTTSDDLTARVWNTELRSQEVSRGFRIGAMTLQTPRDSIYYIAFDPSNERLVTASSRRTTVWDLISGEVLDTLDHDAMILGATFGRAGLTLLTADDTSGQMRRFGPADSVVTFAAYIDSVPDGFLSRDDRHVVTLNFDPPAAILWSTDTGEPIRLDHRDNVYGATFSPDGNRLATTSGNIAYIWSTRGHRIDSLVGHTDPVLTVAYSNNGKLIVTGGDDFTAIVWDAKTAQLLNPLQGHRDAVPTAAFSTNDRLIATGSLDSTVRIWDVALGTTLWTRKVEQPISRIAFSPDDQHMAAVLSDGTVKVWDIGLPGLWSAARTATQVCLTPESHRIVGILSDRRAKKNFAKCEDLFGRGSSIVFQNQ